MTVQTVVVIADLFDEGPSAVPMERRRDLERTHRHVLDRFLGAIHDAGYRTVHYETPAQLADNAGQHKHDVVWSIYGGAASKSRMALVPAICETYRIPYVGPDAYGRIICQDKEVSKALAKDAGLTTANHLLVRDHEQLGRLAGLPWPAVIKPALEGSSIGIGPSSIAKTLDQARRLAGELLDEFKQPILIEEFIPGREVCCCFIEGPTSAATMPFMELFVHDEPEHYLTHLYDAVEKSDEQPPRHYRSIDGELLEVDRVAVSMLLKWMAPLGYGRVDGRLHKGKFVFLEITPDAFVGEDGAFVGGFKLNGWTYSKVIEAVLASVPASRRDQSSNG